MEVIHFYILSPNGWSQGLMMMMSTGYNFVSFSLLKSTIVYVCALSVRPSTLMMSMFLLPLTLILPPLLIPSSLGVRTTRRRTIRRGQFGAGQFDAGQFGATIRSGQFDAKYIL